MAFLRKHYKWVVLLAVILGILCSPLRHYLNKDALLTLLDSLQGAKWAPLWYMGIYVAGVVCFIPITAMILAAAPLFGFWRGLLYVVIASNLGCQLTFWISRFLGQESLERLAGRSPFWEKANGSLSHNGLWFLLFVRLVPVFPFSAVNYLSGLTGVSWRDYTVATFLGMLPGTALFLYVATAAMDARNHPQSLLWATIALLAFAGLLFWLWQKRNPMKS